MSVRALTRGGDYPALEWHGRWIGWDELARMAGCVRALVEVSGADPQARIAMLPRNRPAMMAALLGLIAAGRNITMIHAYQSPGGIARDIARIRPAMVMSAPEDLSDDLTVALRGQGVTVVLLTEMDVAALPGAGRTNFAPDPLPVEPQIELLTSGTTGPPKQFPLSYDMIATHMVGVNLMNTAAIAAPAEVPAILDYLSFNTISGLYLALPALLAGIRIVLVERFTLPVWRDFVVRHRPVSMGVPVPVFQMILEADVPKEELASLRSLTTGTAALDPSVQQAFEEKYGIPILLAYGATEFGGPVTFMTLEDHEKWGRQKPGSVGRAYAGATLRVIDPDTGTELPPGTQGLLEVKTPRMGDHWIRTSDLGVIDADGFVFHRGRADGAINRGGFKLLPDDIERALKLHEAVSAAAVTGISDARLGQVPAAAIQLKRTVAVPGIKDLEEHLRKHVPATHIPTAWIFVDSLPYNAMLKVDRLALRRLFEPEG